RTDAGYARLFREHGLDVDGLSAEEAAARVAARRVRADLVVALDDWAWRLADRAQHRPRWRQLVAIARAAEPDPWRDRLREAAARRDRQALQGLAASADVPGLRTATVELLANALLTAGDREAAVALLRKVWQQRPGDFRVNFFLGLYLSPPPAQEQVKGRWGAALPFLTAAVATHPPHPQAHSALGRALLWNGDPAEAIPAFREAIRLMPNPATADDVQAATSAHQLLAIAWQRQGAFAEALAVYRQGVRLNPADTWSVRQIAYVAQVLATHPDATARNPALAVEAATEAPAPGPKGRASWGVWGVLGTAHYRAGNWKDAAEALGRSVELRPAGEPPGSFFLAMACWRLGRQAEARRHYDRVAGWVDRHRPRDEELRRFRSEAEEVL